MVAVYAMLRALEAGYQAALMAPTETLAEQHAATLDRLLAAEALPFALITGATGRPRGGARRSTASPPASSGCVVGTHALIEPRGRVRAPRRSASSTSSTASGSASAPRSTPRAPTAPLPTSCT